LRQWAVYYGRCPSECFRMTAGVRTGKAQNEPIPVRLLLSTRENDFGRGSPSLGQERRPIPLFKNEGAARAYGKRIEDTFVSLARKRAGLATFSIDETNDRSTWGACRARRPSWARRSLRCDLLLFARSESQREDNGEQANGHDG